MELRRCGLIRWAGCITFLFVAHPLSTLYERGKATSSRLTPTKSAPQGAFITRLSVMDAG
jgi:hypothetical protein